MKTGRQMKTNRIEKGLVEAAHELALTPRSPRCFGLGLGRGFYRGLAPPLRAV